MPCLSLSRIRMGLNRFYGFVNGITVIWNPCNFFQADWVKNLSGLNLLSSSLNLYSPKNLEKIHFFLSYWSEIPPPPSIYQGAGYFYQFSNSSLESVLIHRSSWDWDNDNYVILPPPPPSKNPTINLIKLSQNELPNLHYLEELTF